MWPVLAGLGAAAITALVTLVVARATNSGRVDNSPASDLWATMRSELTRLQSRVSEVEGRLTAAEAELAVSRTEVVALQGEAAKLRACIAELEAAAKG